MLAWGWNMMTRKTASRWLILFSPAKDARFRRDLSHPRRCLDLWMFIRKILRPCFYKSEHMYKNNMEEKAQMAVYLSCLATYSSYMSSNMGLILWAAQIANFVWLSRVMIFYGRPLSQTKYAPRSCVKMNQGIARQGCCLWSWHKKMNNSQSVLP